MTWNWLENALVTSSWKTINDFDNSYTVNNTMKPKWSPANQNGMKLNLGFSCDSWTAVTAVLTVPPKPIKHAHPAVASLFLSIPSLSPFFFQKEAIDIRCKIEAGWGGGWTEERQGCRVSRAQCEQLRGVISQAGSPLSGPWLGRTGGAGEARASKGHQQVGGRFGGGRSWRDRKGRSARPVVGTIHRRDTEEDGWMQESWGEERRGSRVKLGNGCQQVEG